ncbi:MAG: DNA mismatch repair protein MutS [Bacteroidales bacterium]|nr:DNA mismatch repair protein MutS [Bacteroidales bacterium]
MRTFKQFVGTVNGLAYVYENVKVCSSLGKSSLLNQSYMTDSNELEAEFGHIERHIQFRKSHTVEVVELVRQLHELNDISQTLQNLQKLQVLDDIELFEIKKFAFISQRIADLMDRTGYREISLYPMDRVIRMLDPEESRIAHFYIYSAYDPRLAELRKKILQTEDPAEGERLTWEASKIEDGIRQRLSESLQPYGQNLSHNLQQLAQLDVWNAKAQLALEWGLCRPVISEGVTEYRNLFQPEVKSVTESNGGRYQPVDFRLTAAPCLITGANMSGKTVLLKSLALAQYLFQFGFFIPAEEARICPVEEIFCVIDDRQTEQRGLSSFAAEMLSVNEIICQSKQKKRLLVLVDELARTTNPDEGRRLVNAFVTLMERYHVMSVITTHYSGIPFPCRRLRVKGLETDRITSDITPHTLSRYMDYTLVETSSDEVPAEALTIARIFHVDNEFLELAEQN